MRIAIAALSLAAIGLTLLGPANAAVNLVSDGDFSSPSGGATFATYSGGSVFGPWTVTGDSVDLIGGYWQDPNGTSGSVDLDGNAPGGVSQELSLTSGKYLLQFYLSGNPDVPPTTNTVEVSLNSAVGPAFTYSSGSNTRTEMNYTLEDEYFTATGPTDLAFISKDPGGAYGPVIGDVVVSAVPEPATWIMFILGFGAVGSLVRAGRRAQSTAKSTLTV